MIRNIASASCNVSYIENEKWQTVLYTGKICSGITVELQWYHCDLVLTTVVHCMHSLATLNWRLMTAVTTFTWMLLHLLWNECKTYW